MRWCWIDRFVAFESGRYATAVHRVALGTRFLRNHFPPHPLMPKPLVIEGIAQTAGVLVCESRDFSTAVIMAKVPKAVFHCEARPGDVLTYTATVEDIQDAGARVTATSHIGERLHAELEIVFAHVTTGHEGHTPFDTVYFRKIMERCGGFELLRPVQATVALDGLPVDESRPVAELP